MFPCEFSPSLPPSPRHSCFVLFSCTLNAFFLFYIQSPPSPTHRLTFWARQKAAMPTGQKQHNTENTAKPRWSWGRSGERRLSPSQSESLSLDDASYRQERAWMGITHLPCPNALLSIAPKDQYQGLPRNTKTKKCFSRQALDSSVFSSPLRGSCGACLQKRAPPTPKALNSISRSSQVQSEVETDTNRGRSLQKDD